MGNKMADDPNNEKSLHGIKVLDLTRFLSGPQTTLFLAALGAEVVKIDDPKLGDPVANSPPFFGKNGVSMSQNSATDVGIAYLKRARSKKSIELDLKNAQDLDLFKKLVKKADIVVENFRFGVTQRLGIDYEHLKSINPTIIYCSITGYGTTGPAANKKAFDATVQAAAGLMSVTGDPEGPSMKIGSSMGDTIAGTFAFSAILASLLRRAKTGDGEFIDVSMTDCLIALLYDEPWDCYDTLGLSKRQGNRIMRFSPFNCYRAKDGEVVLGAASEKEWDDILEMIDQEDIKYLSKLSSVSDRIQNNQEVDALMSAWTSKHSVREIVDLCDAYGVSCSPVNDASKILDWEQVVSRNILTPVKHSHFSSKSGPLAANFPVKFSSSDVSLKKPAPKPNEHFEEIMKTWLGDEIN